MFLALVSTFSLLCPLYLIYKPPASLLRFFQRRWPDVLFRHATAEKVVALTIDDAPSTHTRAILDLLICNDAIATFFLIGSQIGGHEEVLAELVRAGNELANHAMHDEPSRGLSDAVLAEQIREVHALIQDAYSAAGEDGPETWFFRPGSGFFSSRMRNLVSKLGYRLVLGDVYPHDPHVPFASLNARHILSLVKPGSIIICHDRREWTVPMLREVLPELKRRGYRVVTVSELLKKP
jgi:peptidoglycan/xylan/chitin deacetylase (PgdA/CDA1 family)